MKLANILFLSISIIGLVFITSCNKDEPDEPKIAVENPVNEFVWGALNSWYFYQDEVDELQDDAFTTTDQRNEYLNSFSTPKALFKELKHPEDRFSGIVDDYEELNQSRQGTSLSFGFEFGLLLLSDESSIIGYVRYVLPNSGIDTVDLKRGDIFYGINGQQLTVDNYEELLFQDNSMTFNLAEIIDDEITPIEEGVVITPQVLTENPVFLSKVIDLPNGDKAGYLVYNQFGYTFHEELNDAFEKFQRANVNELIVDFRYNPGGSVYTALTMAGMMYSEAQQGTVFCRFLHNEKKAEEENENFPFLTEVDILDGEFNIIRRETMNRVDVNRVFFLTSGSTASASELMINGLTPYMDVKLIGTTTVGKNESSLTLYDAPGEDWTEKSAANPNHKYALQPIISRIGNVDNFYAYQDGFAPDIEVSEVSALGNMKPLGDPSELLLATAIAQITGETGRFDYRDMPVKARLIDGSNERARKDGLYLDGISNPM